MKVVVDMQRCNGHGQCEDACPEVFHINDVGLPDILMDNPPESLRPKIEEAIRLCPEECIWIEE